MRLSRLLCPALAVLFACFAGAFYAERADAAEGLASWYAPQSPGELTATSDALPVGTQITVSYGDRWVIVTVAGTGAGGRALDVSQPAAEHLGLTEVGTDYVEYTYPGEGVAAQATQPQATQPQATQPQATQPQAVRTQTAQPSQTGAAGGYTVQPGETMYSIATNNGVSVESLAAANGRGEWDMLYAGETLVIPQGSASSASSPGYPGATWYPASDYGNYTAASRPASNPVDKIVVHTTQGSYDSALAWFQDPASGVSAHYTVRASDGAVGQSVSEQNIAHHAGNWYYNQTSVGIEHEGYVEDPYAYTDAMYQSSAQVGAYVADKYGIPINRNHVIGHNEVPGATHTDPGPYWDWNTYMGYMRQYSNGYGQTW